MPAKTYPAVDEPRAEGVHSRIQCLIDNGSPGATLEQGSDIQGGEGFPGHVKLISLVSLKLDEAAAAEVLK